MTNAQERVRYRTVLANREFRALYLAQGLSLVGDQLARIALAILVYQRTGSPLSTAGTYALSYLAYLVGGPLLAGLADRYPRLAVMVVCDLARTPLVLLLCLHGLPLWLVFVMIGLLGAMAPPFDSARGAVQPDVLPGESYVVGNALMNISIQVATVLGFVLGGTIVSLTSVRGALALDGATFLLSAGLLLRGIRHRPAAQSAPGTVFGDMLSAFRLVARSPDLRRPLVLSVLASVAVVGTEGLAVLVARDLHGGAVLAGALTATGPLGFLIGTGLILRLDLDRRLQLMPRLVVLSGLPLLATPWVPSAAMMLVLWTVAGIGIAVNLIAGPAFMQRCPREIRARAFGVASTCLWASQGLGLIAAGALADVVTPRQAVAIVAGATLVLALPVLGAKGNGRSGRGVT